MSSVEAIDPVDSEFTQRRSSMRVRIPQDEPLYLQVNLGTLTNLPVTDLGGGGAQILCRDCRTSSDKFQVGLSLGKSVLMLGKHGMHEVEPVIQWKRWPSIGVQFMGLSDKNREIIFKFLFELERKTIKRMNNT
jgi:c-di-GMP-binding flagellar brake protein YcgR